MQSKNNIRELLEWYVEAGVDETIAMQPIKPTAKKVVSEREQAAAIIAPVAAQMMPILNPSKAVSEARTLAEAANSLDELREAVMKFEACMLKKTARKTVFSDGTPNADVMVIGEAPGENEDEQGIPFCGKSGQLLDNSLRAIGLERSKNLYISNTIFWRPPGNRTPSPEEVAICAPFVKKHIALINPKLLILAGAVAGSVLGKADSVSKLRRRFHSYTNEYLTKEIPAVVIYHPSYLLRQPGQKAAQWQDLLMIQEYLNAH